MVAINFNDKYFMAKIEALQRFNIQQIDSMDFMSASMSVLA